MLIAGGEDAGRGRGLVPLPRRQPGQPGAGRRRRRAHRRGDRDEGAGLMVELAMSTRTRWAASPTASSACGRLTAWRTSRTPRRAPATTAGARCPLCKTPDDDRDHLIVHRGEHCYVVLNLYPVQPRPPHGLPVPPRRLVHRGHRCRTRRDGRADPAGMRVLQGLTGTQGFNIGMNQGATGGAGIHEHLHQHVVPRWVGDSNFLPIIAQTKALPELLDDTWQRVSEAWAKDGTRWSSWMAAPPFMAAPSEGAREALLKTQGAPQRHDRSSARSGVVFGAVFFFPQAGRFVLRGALVITFFVMTRHARRHDGAHVGQVVAPGAFLDSTLDRVADAAIFGALVWGFRDEAPHHGPRRAVCLTVGSSFRTRARGGGPRDRGQDGHRRALGPARDRLTATGLVGLGSPLWVLTWTLCAAGRGRAHHGGPAHVGGRGKADRKDRPVDSRRGTTAGALGHR